MEKQHLSCSSLGLKRAPQSSVGISFSPVVTSSQAQPSRSQSFEVQCESGGNGFYIPSPAFPYPILFPPPGSVRKRPKRALKPRKIVPLLYQKPRRRSIPCIIDEGDFKDPTLLPMERKIMLRYSLEGKTQSGDQPVEGELDVIVEKDECVCGVDEKTGKVVFRYWPAKATGIDEADLERAFRAFGKPMPLSGRSFKRVEAAPDIDVSMFKSKSYIFTRKKAIYMHKGQKYYKCMPMRSYKVGSTYDRFNNNIVIGNYSKKHPEALIEATSFLLKLWKVSKTMMPASSVQLLENNCPQKYKILGEIPFSTIQLNDTEAMCNHIDRNDIKGGWSVLTVLRRGSYSGGLYIMPHWSVGIDMTNGGLLISQSHKNMHGNNLIIKKTPEAQRISLVLYLGSKLSCCRDNQEVN